MSPDSPEARLGRLETAVARLEQRTDDLSTDVRTLTPLIVAVAEVKITVSQIQLDGASTRAAVEALKTSIDQRQMDASRDSKNFRRTLVGIGIAAVLSPVGTLVVTLLAARPR
jgi:hypothetical protein